MGATLSDAFKAQGFASAEILARWGDIVGPEIAAHSEPLKINWPRQTGAETAEPATLVLRVEGPAAIEIQHLSAVILERVNRFFGWQAVGRIALRQAPLRRREPRKPPPPPDPEVAARIAESCRRSTTTICARPWPAWARPSSENEHAPSWQDPARHCHNSRIQLAPSAPIGTASAFSLRSVICRSYPS